MSLVVRIGINHDEPIAIVTAKRITHRHRTDLPPDTRAMYEVEFRKRPAPDLPFGVVASTQVEHRFGDGAELLAARALAAVTAVR